MNHLPWNILTRLSPGQSAPALAAAVVSRLKRMVSLDTAAVWDVLQYVSMKKGEFRSIAGGIEVELPGRPGEGGAKFRLRHGSTDFRVFKLVYLDQEYAPLIAEVRRKFPRKVELVIDAGANAGFTSVLLANSFPDARVFSVEPSPGNVTALRANADINNLGHRIVPMQGGLWPDAAFLRISTGFRDGREWSLAVQETAENDPAASRAITFDDILRLAGQSRIDVLKMDIEGAERLWFESRSRFVDLLGRTEALAIEVHPEAIDPIVVLEALDAMNFFHMRVGETVFAFSRNWYAVEVPWQVDGPRRR